MISLLYLFITLISRTLSEEINGHILVIAPPILSHILRKYFSSEKHRWQ
jgi:hypothetical protein